MPYALREPSQESRILKFLDCCPEYAIYENGVKLDTQINSRHKRKIYRQMSIAENRVIENIWAVVRNMRFMRMGKL